MLVTLAGSVMLIRLPQSWNCCSMVVIPFPIVTLVKLVQSQNGTCPRLVTLFGMVRLVRLAQLAKP